MFLLLGVCNTAAAGGAGLTFTEIGIRRESTAPTKLTSTMAKPLEYAKLVPGFLARYRLFVKGGIMAHGRNDMPE